MAVKRTLSLALALALLSPVALAATGDTASPVQVDAPSTEACANVPCGYIYPLILIRTDPDAEPYEMAVGDSLEIPATITFRFDIMAEGFTLPNPQDPIQITFEFPRKPDWAEMAVEPKRIDVPIQPQYIQPDPSDPNNVQAHYEYTTDVTITIDMVDRAVLRDGTDQARLLLFAKSSESGLYKSGYGIRQFRITPEDPLFESDLAPAEPMEVVDLAPATPEPAERHAPGLTVGMTPPDGGVDAWEPAPFRFTFSDDAGDARPVKAIVTLLDEAGNVAYNTGPREVRNGELETALTLTGPGRHTIAVHATPAASDGAAAPFTPQSFAFPVTVPADDGDAVRHPRQYEARYTEVVTSPRGNVSTVEPFAQYEKIIPFPAFEDASGAAATVTLTSGWAENGPGSMNAVVQLLAPSGRILSQGSLDPVTGARSVQAGALPEEGQYALRVAGTGMPEGSTFDARITVSYDGEPEIPLTANGVPDVVERAAAFGPANFTFTGETTELAPWAPTDLGASVDLDGATFEGDAAFTFTVTDADGHPVAASGTRPSTGGDAPASFTPPGPGRYTALLTATPKETGPTWEPVTLAFPLTVGDADAPTTTLPDAFTLSDAGSFPAAARPTWTPVTEHVLDVHPDADAFTASADASAASVLTTLQLVDADGAVVAEGAALDEALEPGTYVLRLLARGAGAFDATVAADVAYAAAPEVANPLYADTADDEVPGTPIPAPAIVTVLGVLALAGVAAAKRRRG